MALLHSWCIESNTQNGSNPHTIAAFDYVCHQEVHNSEKGVRNDPWAISSPEE